MDDRTRHRTLYNRMLREFRMMKAKSVGDVENRQQQLSTELYKSTSNTSNSSEQNDSWRSSGDQAEEHHPETLELAHSLIEYNEDHQENSEENQENSEENQPSSEETYQQCSDSYDDCQRIAAEINSSKNANTSSSRPLPRSKCGHRARMNIRKRRSFFNVPAQLDDQPDVVEDERSWNCPEFYSFADPFPELIGYLTLTFLAECGSCWKYMARLKGMRPVHEKFLRRMVQLERMEKSALRQTKRSQKTLSPLLSKSGKRLSKQILRQAPDDEDEEQEERCPKCDKVHRVKESTCLWNAYAGFCRESMLLAADVTKPTPPNNGTESLKRDKLDKTSPKVNHRSKKMR